MSWHDEYPHKLYYQVLLLDNKMIDWKISGSKKDVLNWSLKIPTRINGIANIVTKEIVVNDDKEHNQAFDDMSWFEQFKGDCK